MVLVLDGVQNVGVGGVACLGAACRASCHWGSPTRLAPLLCTLARTPEPCPAASPASRARPFPLLRRAVHTRARPPPRRPPAASG
jgi:hypothetical protein